MVANFDFTRYQIANNNIQWLALQTLNRTDEAVEVIRPLDEPDVLLRLVGMLSYTHFDPAPFPNLTALLEEQGVMRRETTPLQFACRR